MPPRSPSPPAVSATPRSAGTRPRRCGSATSTSSPRTRTSPSSSAPSAPPAWGSTCRRPPTWCLPSCPGPTPSRPRRSTGSTASGRPSRSPRGGSSPPRPSTPASPSSSGPRPAWPPAPWTARTTRCRTRSTSGWTCSPPCSPTHSARTWSRSSSDLTAEPPWQVGSRRRPGRVPPPAAPKCSTRAPSCRWDEQEGVCMEGLAAITQRIAGIEAQLTALSNPPAPAPETASSSFDQALSSASGEFAPQAAAAGALARLAAAAQGLGAFGGGRDTPGLRNALGASGLLGGAGLQGLAGLQGVSGVQGAAGAYAPPAVLNDKGAPADLAHYGNGQIPEQALVPIDATGHRLWAPAAVQFQQLIAEASAQGITIGINDSYRTIERQHELVPRLGLYNEGGLAAVPGTSRHGWGLAVDLQLNGEAQAWMRDNAERFGFVEDTPREPWHWAFYPDRL